MNPIPESEISGVCKAQFSHLVRPPLGQAGGSGRLFVLAVIFFGVLSDRGIVLLLSPLFLHGTSAPDALSELARPQYHHVAESEGEERGVKAPDSAERKSEIQK